MENIQIHVTDKKIGNISVSSQMTHAIVLARSGLQTLTSRQQVRQIFLANHVLHGCPPRHVLLATTGWRTLADHLGDSSLVLRSSDSVRLPRPRKNYLKASPLYMSFSLFNSLPHDLRQNPTNAKIRTFFYS